MNKLHAPFKGYYEHIDGLRALAVIAVLLLHCDFYIFSGGFVGVDVFFVISGFLITKIIVKELDSTNEFSFSRFYTRRIKRIMPALIFTLIFSFVLSIWLLNLAKFKVFGGSLATSALSVSNIFFYKEAGYFDIFSQSNPLLHTWSLGVEEQFYMFWPILLLVTFKFFRKRFISVLCCLFVISLTLNFIYQNKNLTGLYYLVQFRVFEFCIGAILVWMMRKPKAVKNYILEILCFLGLLSILYAIFMFDSNTLFPSYNALIPAIGSGLIIYAGTAKYSGMIFRVKPVRFIGLISYSLYLIHWPLIVFFKTYNEDIGLPFSLSFHAKVVVVSLSFMMATFMFYFVEQPFRRSIPKDKTRQLFLISRWLFVIALIAILGAFIFYSKGWLWRARAPIAAANVNDISKYHVENWGGAGFSGGYIYKGENPNPMIVMMGDSHNGMLSEGIVNEIAKPYDLTVFTACAGGAGKYLSSLLLPGTTILTANQAGFDKSAREAHVEAIDKLLETKNSIFIYSASYHDQINMTGDLETHESWGITTQHNKSYNDYKPFIAALDRLRNMLNGHPFVLIGGFPFGSEYNVMKCIGGLKWFDSYDCLSIQSEFLTPQINTVNNILKEYSSLYKDVYFINPFSVFCKNGECMNTDIEGNPLYSDGSHLSKTGSIYFINHIKQELLDIINQ